MFNFSKPGSQRIFRKARFGLDKFVLVHRYRVHYIEAGQGETIVLIPGSAGTYRMWNRLMPLLATRYRVMALDYPPAAVDEKDPVKALRAQADLIAQALEQLNIEKVILVGTGSGGALAFDLAARYPEHIVKVVSILGQLNIVESARKPSKKATLAAETELKGISAPIMYLYGTRTNEREVPITRYVEMLQKLQPKTWIVALDGGIFETAIKDPAEVANLVLDFLKARG